MSEVQRLREIVARLRAPDGCPWDREQDHRSLARCLSEECAELLDTIDRLDLEHMREELGDVLLQVVFHAQLAEEAGRFDLEAVAREISDKLVRRHPHVFGEGKLDTAEAVLNQWDQIKAQEKEAKAGGAVPEPRLKRLPPALPVLLAASETWKQLKRQGLPECGPGEAAVARLAEGLDESTAGQVFFALAAACRERGIDPESALRRAVAAVRAEAEAAPAAAGRAGAAAGA